MYLNKCRVSFDCFTSHCKWLPTSVFHGQNPGLINQQIIQTDDRKINYHKFICTLNSKFNYDCAIDTLGPVYPGQLLWIDVFTPCSNTSVIYAETHNNLLPSTACRIAHQTELLNTINNHSGILNFTIVSDNTDMCELFLQYLHIYIMYTKHFMSDYFLVQLGSHYKMEYVIVILFYHLILTHVTLNNQLSDVLLPGG